MLDIVQLFFSFPFIFLLYCGSHEHVYIYIYIYIYISPICNAAAFLFSNIIKIRDSPFLSSHGIKAKLLVTQMQIRLAHPHIDAPLQGTVFSLVVT